MTLEGAKFICLDEAGNHGETVVAKGRKFTVGYYVNCDFVLADDRSKGVHCEIVCDAFGRVTIRNLSPDKQILLNGSPVEIKRSLLNNTKLTILDKEYLWLFPKVTSNEFEDLPSDAVSTPQKQIGIPEQPPNSCPDFKLHRELPKRFTVHNFAYCIQSDDEGNTSTDSNEENITEDKKDSQNVITEEDKNKESTENQIEKDDKDSKDTENSNNTRNRSVTPEPKEEEKDNSSAKLVTPKMNLINCTKDKENNSTQKKNKQLLTLCHQSDVVITSFSPRETGVKAEKSFTAIIKPKVLVTKPPTTPKSVYSTPKSEINNDDEEEDKELINFHTPSTSKKGTETGTTTTASKVLKNSSMHLVDLTTPNRLRPASPYVKSALKASTIKNQTQTADKSIVKLNVDEQLGLSALPLTPVVDSSNSHLETPSSIVSVSSSTDSSSVVEITSDGSNLGITPSNASNLTTPIKQQQTRTGACTPKRTPQSLRTRAILTSAKKQATTATATTTPRRPNINRIPIRSNLALTSPATPKASQLPRRQSMSTPTRKSISRFDATPSTSHFVTSSPTSSSSLASRRSSLNPMSTARTLPTSTPVAASYTANSSQSASKTSTLHKVRKSVGGIPLSSHISKTRRSIALPASASKLTSVKEKSPQQVMASRLSSRARKSFCVTPTSGRPATRTTPICPSSILKESQPERKPTEQRKAVLFADKHTVKDKDNDLSRTFIVDSDEEEGNTNKNEGDINKTKDATFSPEKNKKLDETDKATLTTGHTEDNLQIYNVVKSLEIPLDVEEITLPKENNPEIKEITDQEVKETNNEKLEEIETKEVNNEKQNQTTKETYAADLKEINNEKDSQENKENSDKNIVLAAVDKKESTVSEESFAEIIKVTQEEIEENLDQNKVKESIEISDSPIATLHITQEDIKENLETNKVEESIEIFDSPNEASTTRELTDEKLERNKMEESIEILDIPKKSTESHESFAEVIDITKEVTNEDDSKTLEKEKLLEANTTKELIDKNLEGNNMEESLKICDSPKKSSSTESQESFADTTKEETKGENSKTSDKEKLTEAEVVETGFGEESIVEILETSTNEKTEDKQEDETNDKENKPEEIILCEGNKLEEKNSTKTTVQDSDDITCNKILAEDRKEKNHKDELEEQNKNIEELKSDDYKPIYEDITLEGSLIEKETKDAEESHLTKQPIYEDITLEGSLLEDNNKNESNLQETPNKQKDEKMSKDSEIVEQIELEKSKQFLDEVTEDTDNNDSGDVEDQIEISNNEQKIVEQLKSEETLEEPQNEIAGEEDLQEVTNNDTENSQIVEQFEVENTEEEEENSETVEQQDHLNKSEMDSSIILTETETNDTSKLLEEIEDALNKSDEIKQKHLDEMLQQNKEEVHKVKNNESDLSETEANTSKLLEEIEDVLNKSDEIKQRHLDEIQQQQEYSDTPLTEEFESENLTQETNKSTQEQNEEILNFENEKVVEKLESKEQIEQTIDNSDEQENVFENNSISISEENKETNSKSSDIESNSQKISTEANTPEIVTESESKSQEQTVDNSKYIDDQENVLENDGLSISEENKETDSKSLENEAVSDVQVNSQKISTETDTQKIYIESESKPQEEVANESKNQDTTSEFQSKIQCHEVIAETESQEIVIAEPVLENIPSVSSIKKKIEIVSTPKRTTRRTSLSAVESVNKTAESKETDSKSQENAENKNVADVESITEAESKSQEEVAIDSTNQDTTSKVQSEIQCHEVIAETESQESVVTEPVLENIPSVSSTKKKIENVSTPKRTTRRSSLSAESSVNQTAETITPKRSTRRTSLTAEISTTQTTETTLTPRRSTRRASLSAESTNTLTPTKKATRRASLSAVSETPLTPKRITSRRSSIDDEPKPILEVKTPRAKTPRKQLEQRMVIPEEMEYEIGAIIEEEEEPNDEKTANENKEKDIVEEALATDKKEVLEKTDVLKSEKTEVLSADEKEATNSDVVLQTNENESEAIIEILPLDIEDNVEEISNASLVTNEEVTIGYETTEKSTTSEILKDSIKTLNKEDVDISLLDQVVEKDITMETISKDAENVNISDDDEFSESKELKTPKTKKNIKTVADSVKTPAMTGIRELLKTPNEAKTPKFGGIRNLIRTPKVTQETEEEEMEMEKLALVADLVKTPQVQISENIEDNLKEMDEIPTTSADVVISTPISKKSAYIVADSPKTSKATGLRELFKKTKADSNTLKIEHENDEEETEKLAVVADLVKTPQISQELEVTALVMDEIPSTSTKDMHLRGVKELLKTPKICSTPRFKGMRELMQTPKMCSTPLMGGIKELMKTPDQHKDHDLSKVENENFDKFLKTPTAKNIMIPSLPSSAIIEKSSASIDISTEYDLNASHEEGSANLEELFKTPVAARFEERITASYYGEEGEHHDETVEKFNKTKKETLQEKLNKSAKEADEFQIQTPISKKYPRKSLALLTPHAESPFSAADVLSDLPKTDVEEWIETLDEAEPPMLEDVENTEVAEEEINESVQEVPDNDVSCLEDSLVEQNKNVTKNDTIIPETCAKVYLSEKCLSNISSTSEGMLNLSAIQKTNSKDLLENTTTKIKEKETRSVTPIEAEISGLNLLDQTVESIQDEPSMLEEPSMFEEHLVVSDNDSEADITVNNPNKEEGNQTLDANEDAPEDNNDLSEPLLVSDSEDFNESQEENKDQTISEDPLGAIKVDTEIICQEEPSKVVEKSILMEETNKEISFTKDPLHSEQDETTVKLESEKVEICEEPQSSSLDVINLDTSEIEDTEEKSENIKEPEFQDIEILELEDSVVEEISISEETLNQDSKVEEGSSKYNNVEDNEEKSEITKEPESQEIEVLVLEDSIVEEISISEETLNQDSKVEKESSKDYNVEDSSVVEDLEKSIIEEDSCNDNNVEELMVHDYNKDSGSNFNPIIEKEQVVEAKDVEKSTLENSLTVDTIEILTATLHTVKDDEDLISGTLLSEQEVSLAKQKGSEEIENTSDLKTSVNETEINSEDIATTSQIGFPENVVVLEDSFVEEISIIEETPNKDSRAKKGTSKQNNVEDSSVIEVLKKSNEESSSDNNTEEPITIHKEAKDVENFILEDSFTESKCNEGHVSEINVSKEETTETTSETVKNSEEPISDPSSSEHEISLAKQKDFAKETNSEDITTTSNIRSPEKVEEDISEKIEENQLIIESVKESSILIVKDQAVADANVQDVETKDVENFVLEVSFNENVSEINSSREEASEILTTTPETVTNIEDPISDPSSSEQKISLTEQKDFEDTNVKKDSEETNIKLSKDGTHETVKNSKDLISPEKTVEAISEKIVENNENVTESAVLVVKDQAENAVLEVSFTDNNCNEEPISEINLSKVQATEILTTTLETVKDSEDLIFDPSSSEQEISLADTKISEIETEINFKDIAATSDIQSEVKSVVKDAITEKIEENLITDKNIEDSAIEEQLVKDKSLEVSKKERKSADIFMDTSGSENSEPLDSSIKNDEATKETETSKETASTTNSAKETKKEFNQECEESSKKDSSKVEESFADEATNDEKDVENESAMVEVTTKEKASKDTEIETDKEEAEDVAVTETCGDTENEETNQKIIIVENQPISKIADTEPLVTKGSIKDKIIEESISEITSQDITESKEKDSNNFTESDKQVLQDVFEAIENEIATKEVEESITEVITESKATENITESHEIASEINTESNDKISQEVLEVEVEESITEVITKSEASESITESDKITSKIITESDKVLQEVLITNVSQNILEKDGESEQTTKDNTAIKESEHKLDSKINSQLEESKPEKTESSDVLKTEDIKSIENETEKVVSSDATQELETSIAVTEVQVHSSIEQSKLNTEQKSLALQVSKDKLESQNTNSLQIEESKKVEDETSSIETSQEMKSAKDSLTAKTSKSEVIEFVKESTDNETTSTSSEKTADEVVTTYDFEVKINDTESGFKVETQSETVDIRTEKATTKRGRGRKGSQSSECSDLELPTTSRVRKNTKTTEKVSKSTEQTIEEIQDNSIKRGKRTHTISESSQSSVHEDDSKSAKRRGRKGKLQTTPIEEDVLEKIEENEEQLTVSTELNQALVEDDDKETASTDVTEENENIQPVVDEPKVIAEKVVEVVKKESILPGRRKRTASDSSQDSVYDDTNSTTRRNRRKVQKIPVEATVVEEKRETVELTITSSVQEENKIKLSTASPQKETKLASTEKQELSAAIPQQDAQKDVSKETELNSEIIEESIDHTGEGRREKTESNEMQTTSTTEDKPVTLNKDGENKVEELSSVSNQQENEVKSAELTESQENVADNAEIEVTPIENVVEIPEETIKEIKEHAIKRGHRKPTVSESSQGSVQNEDSKVRKGHRKVQKKSTEETVIEETGETSSLSTKQIIEREDLEEEDTPIEKLEKQASDDNKILKDTVKETEEHTIKRGRRKPTVSESSQGSVHDEDKTTLKGRRKVQKAPVEEILKEENQENEKLPTTSTATNVELIQSKTEAGEKQKNKIVDELVQVLPKEVEDNVKSIESMETIRREKEDIEKQVEVKRGRRKATVSESSQGSIHEDDDNSHKRRARRKVQKTPVEETLVEEKQDIEELPKISISAEEQVNTNDMPEKKEEIGEPTILSNTDVTEKNAKVSETLEPEQQSTTTEVEGKNLDETKEQAVKRGRPKATSLESKQGSVHGDDSNTNTRSGRRKAQKTPVEKPLVEELPSTSTAKKEEKDPVEAPPVEELPTTSAAHEEDQLLSISESKETEKTKKSSDKDESLKELVEDIAEAVEEIKKPAVTRECSKPTVAESSVLVEQVHEEPPSTIAKLLEDKQTTKSATLKEIDLPKDDKDAAPIKETKDTEALKVPEATSTEKTEVITTTIRDQQEDDASTSVKRGVGRRKATVSESSDTEIPKSRSKSRNRKTPSDQQTVKELQVVIEEPKVKLISTENPATKIDEIMVLDEVTKSSENPNTSEHEKLEEVHTEEHKPTKKRGKRTRTASESSQGSVADEEPTKRRARHHNQMDEIEEEQIIHESKTVDAEKVEEPAEMDSVTQDLLESDSISQPKDQTVKEKAVHEVVENKTESVEVNEPQVQEVTEKPQKYSRRRVGVATRKDHGDQQEEPTTKSRRGRGKHNDKEEQQQKAEEDNKLQVDVSKVQSTEVNLELEDHPTSGEEKDKVVRGRRGRKHIVAEDDEKAEEVDKPQVDLSKVQSTEVNLELEDHPTSGEEKDKVVRGRRGRKHIVAEDDEKAEEVDKPQADLSKVQSTEINLELEDHPASGEEKHKVTRGRRGRKHIVAEDDEKAEEVATPPVVLSKVQVTEVNLELEDHPGSAEEKHKVVRGRRGRKHIVAEDDEKAEEVDKPQVESSKVQITEVNLELEDHPSGDEKNKVVRGRRGRKHIVAEDDVKEHETKSATKRRSTGKQETDEHEESGPVSKRRAGRKKQEHDADISLEETTHTEGQKHIVAEDDEKEHETKSATKRRSAGKQETVDHEESSPVSKKRAGRKKQEHDEHDADISHEETKHTESAPSSKRRVGRKKQDEEQEEGEHKTNLIDKEKPVEALAHVEVKKGRGRKNKDEESEHPTTSQSPDKKTRGRKRKESHTDNEDHQNSDETVTKKPEHKVELPTADIAPQTPQRSGPAPRRGRKASAINVDKHSHITADDSEDSPSKRPLRKAATTYHNYDETSDSDKQTKTKKKTDSPRKSLEAVTKISPDATVKTITDATPSTSTPVATTARGRTRKPTAKVQQFLEEERAKAETPKKRALLAAAIARTDTPTPQRMPGRRGRKPSTIETDVVETVGTPQASKRGRGKAATHTEADHKETPAVVIEETEHKTPPATTAAKGRRGGRKAKTSAEDHVEDEPPAKKSPIQLEAEKQETSPEVDSTTPTRTAGKRGAAAAAKARIEEDALAAAAIDPPKRAKAKKVLPAKIATDSEDHSSEEAKSVKVAKDSSPQKRDHRLTSASTIEGAEDLNTDEESQTIDKPTNKRGARKVAAPTTTDSPAAVPAKRGRKAKVADTEAHEPEHTDEPKTSRGVGRGRKNVQAEKEKATPETESEHHSTAEQTAEETLAPVKRGTRTRRK